MRLSFEGRELHFYKIKMQHTFIYANHNAGDQSEVKPALGPLLDRSSQYTVSIYQSQDIDKWHVGMETDGNDQHDFRMGMNKLAFKMVQISNRSGNIEPN